ncbi:galactarate dehydratase [uncultured Desulfovibrio sp.]|uniref:galactarate dehydratase n=1 Tax=uncultured Desulfovibrio sp. TaxID=167968 RepID=UPI00260345AA|nr:galactarate dehydratase [uncultured Desulfovibrio sp.]
MNQSNATPGLCVRIHPDDNVAVIVNDDGLPPGAALVNGPVLKEHIPQGHKVALADIASGQVVRRYGVTIGYALEDIQAGMWVSEQRMRMPEPPELDHLVYCPRSFPAFSPLEGRSFQGYRNDDGTFGTRNILAIGACVQCAAGVLDVAVQRARQELLPRYPNVDDIVAINHIYGCGVAIDAPAAPIPIRTLRNILRNPNFGGMPLLCSLGCEKLTPEKLMPSNTPETVCLQDEQYHGFESMLDALLDAMRRRLELMDKRKREACPASGLRVGMQCGGSDAFSGITANPALGAAADRIVRAGGTAFFSEVTEVRDGIDQLVARAASTEVAQGLIREMRWYDDYLAAGGVDRSANTTPGNKKGGLNNITEKAMGSLIKSGSAPIVGVVSPGEQLPQNAAGLYYVATPASDFVCGTLQLAAGMNLHIFSTGRGTPYGLREVPVIKVATRTELARRWHDLMDFDAGGIATGASSIDQCGEDLFNMILDVASGKRQTCTDRWGLYNDLALFNPAPIT